MDDGQTVLGSLVLTKTPEFYEILAYVGFDFVIVDQMHSSLSWEDLANIVQTLRGSDTAVVRDQKQIHGMALMTQALLIE